MLLLWKRAPRLASEVASDLAPDHDWSERTVKTMLARLVKKGALTATPEGKRYLYEPAVSREACVRRETRSFLDRVFGGSASPLLAHFVREGQLDEGQLDELRDLLKEEER